MEDTSHSPRHRKGTLQEESSGYMDCNDYVMNMSSTSELNIYQQKSGCEDIYRYPTNTFPHENQDDVVVLHQNYIQYENAVLTPSLPVLAHQEQAKNVNIPCSKSKLTFREVMEHNAQYPDWFMYQEKIYKTDALRDHFAPVLLQIIATENCPRSYVYVNSRDLYDLFFWKCRPIGILRDFKISEDDIKVVLADCYIADYEKLTEEYYWSDIKRDISELKKDLENTQELPEGQKDYLDLLSRWMDKYRFRNPETELEKGFGDPNSMPFPLPLDIARDPFMLRKWIESWEKFDTEITEEDICDETDGFDPALDPDEVFKDSLRPETREGDQFCTDIEGDSAWDTVSLDLIKDDTTTAKQEEIIRVREKRSDLGDKVMMKKRREKLATYFKDTYSIDPCTLETYLEFASVMEKNDKELKALSE